MSGESGKPSLFDVELDFENPSPWVRPNRPWEKWYKQAVRDDGEKVNIPKTIKYPEIPIHYFGRQAALDYPNNVAVYYTPEEKKYTYRELMYYSDKLSAALSDLGVGKNDSVAIFMANTPEFLFSLYGVTQTGAAVTPINPLLKAPDIAYIIRDSSIIHTLICTSNLYPIVKQTLEEVELENVITVGQKTPGTIDFWEMIGKYPAKPPDVTINPKEDICALMYSGGTTGLPKGVMLTHYNIVANALASVYFQVGDDRSRMGKGVVLATLPMCHVFGFTMVQSYIYGKSMIVMYAGFDPDVVMRDIEKYRSEAFVGIPLMYYMMVTHPNFKKYDLSSLKLAVSGADTLPPAVFEQWKKVTNLDVGQGYGLSEASPVTHSQPPWLPKIGNSIGIPIIDTDAKIVDLETGTKELPPGEVGELMIRGPQVMKGYWKQPEKTKETITEDGWLHTGDLARMDENGYFYIVGRLKEIIKYKGYKIMPEDVENELSKHPAIQQCVVIGVPDPKTGETIKAFIVLKNEYKGKIKEKEIIDWAKENMAGYKYPRKIEFIDTIPRTAVGKVFRRKLKEMELSKTTPS
ncbi:MAG: long-chain fatty acid--CoA ligase [Candidatus Jordarchaeaceae archaeon]